MSARLQRLVDGVGALVGGHEVRVVGAVLSRRIMYDDSCICVHLYIYIYIYIERERETEREIDIYTHMCIICIYIYRERERDTWVVGAVLRVPGALRFSYYLHAVRMSIICVCNI